MAPNKSALRDKQGVTLCRRGPASLEGNMGNVGLGPAMSISYGKAVRSLEL